MNNFREYLGKHLEHISKPIGKGLLYEITTPQATHADEITEENSQITKEDNVSPFLLRKVNSMSVVIKNDYCFATATVYSPFSGNKSSVISDILPR